MASLTTIINRISFQFQQAVVGLLGMSVFSVCSAESAIALNGYVSIASDYVYRGVSLGGGRLSPSLSLAGNHDSGVYISLWAARDDLGGAFNDSRRRDTEIEYQLGYQRQFNADWSASVSHAWLEYQNRFQPRNHDYRESRVNIHYRDRYSAFIGYARDIWTSGLDATTLALSHRAAAPYGFYLEQELGITDYNSQVDTRRNSSLGFIRLSVAKEILPRWSVALSYHYSKASNDATFADERIGSQSVISSTYHFDGEI